MPDFERRYPRRLRRSISQPESAQGSGHLGSTSKDEESGSDQVCLQALQGSGICLVHVSRSLSRRGHFYRQQQLVGLSQVLLQLLHKAMQLL